MKLTNRIIPLLTLYTMAILQLSCARQPYYIDTHTQQDESGDFVIQWSVKPGMEGDVEIFASTDATQYPNQPFVTESIGKEITYYSSNGSIFTQVYFMMIFDGREMRIASSRTIPTNGILNFRDVGGYMTSTGEQVRWGRLYRSGDLWRLFQSDLPTIASLGIRKHYILSPSRVAQDNAIPQLGLSTLESRYIAPDNIIDFQDLLDQIYQGKFKPSEIQDMHKAVFRDIAFSNTDQISNVMHLLIDPNNYPVLLSDDLGKNRVAFIVMLVQNVLGVSKSDIINDYVLSNQNLPVQRLEPEGFLETQLVQEGLTDFFRCDPNHMNDIMDEIESRFGSISNYLQEYLDFDTRDQDQLRNILLY